MTRIRIGSLRSAVVASVALLHLSGCAAPVGLMLAGAGSGVAMGTGVDYTMNGIAYRTFVAPLPNVRRATLAGANRMGMKVSEDKKTDDGWNVVAIAKDREITIELEALTPRTTRIRVVASNSLIFKDRATAAALIDQVADALDRRTVARS